MSAEPAELAVVFRGPKVLCREFSLVLEARGIEHEVQATGIPEPGGPWIVTVPSALAHRAYDELTRYSAERSMPRSIPLVTAPFPGAASGALGYALILLLTAYCAGIGLFGVDWLSAGALDAGAGREWWRALTALTLHLDQEHLLGNLLFGVIAGVAAGRLLGPGVAWASILGAAAGGELCGGAHCAGRASRRRRFHCRVRRLGAARGLGVAAATDAAAAALVSLVAAGRGSLFADLVGRGRCTRGCARARARISGRGRRGLAACACRCAPQPGQGAADRHGHRGRLADMCGVDLRPALGARLRIGT